MLHVRNILTKLLPRCCILCNDDIVYEDWFCSDCRKNLPYIRSACQICGTATISNQACGRCLAHPPYFEFTIVPLRFCEPISILIRRLKYHHQFYLGNTLAKLLLDVVIHRDHNYPDLIIPVPLHKKRLRQRGFNQSALLAKILAKKLNIKYRHNYLTRIKYSRPQVELTAGERKQAVKNAFLAKPGNKYKHVALVDDVITTSHTANQASRALKRAGIEKVTVWAVARNST